MEKIIGTYSTDGIIIEYSIKGEKGEPILVMHGGHSNCYEEFEYDSLIENGFRIITPSRAGYGKTSKELGEGLSKACDYYISLLDYLGIDKVHLLAISAGGPSGLYFASHYPDRVKTLILLSAVTKEWHTPEDNIYKVAQVLFHPTLEKMTWTLIAKMSNCFPKFIFRQMASSFSTLTYVQIKNLMDYEDVDEIRRINNRQRSKYGFIIDLSQTKEITINELKTISCPTLILHSKHDGAVSLEHAQYAHQNISGSELFVFDTWGHLVWLGKNSEGVIEKMTEFLLKEKIVEEGKSQI